jgi:hypothetical protein
MIRISKNTNLKKKIPNISMSQNEIVSGLDSNKLANVTNI